MGSCGGICNNNVYKGNGDVSIEKLTMEEMRKYSKSPYYSFVIYLQIRIRHFLKRIKKRKININGSVKGCKSTAKSTATGKNPQELNNLLNKEENGQHKSKKGSKGKKNDPNTIENGMSLNNKENANKYKKYDDEPTDEMMIPTLKVNLMENNIFSKDAFCKGIRSNQNKIENDPRDGPFDGVRRKFPKILEEQSSYEGEWKDGKRDGFGILCWGDESKFMGYFSEDKVVGYGKLWHEDGDVYKGYWREFQADGIGIYQTQKNAFFRGFWSHDRQNGFGLEKWPRGSNFLGDYVDGNKEGIGILNFEDRASYQGEFRDGIISGIGTFSFEDNRKYQGEWLNNKMHGYGFIIWPDGNYFEGQFYEDKKEGFGVFYSSGKVYMGMWKNNKLEGNVIIVDDGKTKKQYWENGKGVRVLQSDTPIYFEKFIDELFKKKKKKKPKKSKDNKDEE